MPRRWCEERLVYGKRRGGATTVVATLTELLTLGQRTTPASACSFFFRGKIVLYALSTIPDKKTVGV